MLFAPDGLRPIRVRSRLDPFLLLSLAGATVWAATRSARLELDVENRSMRSTGRSEARAEEERERLFGHDATLVLLLGPGQLAGSQESDEDVLDQWVAGLRARPEASQCLVLPGAEDEERLLALTLKRDAVGGVAEHLRSLVAAAEANTPRTHILWVSGTPAGEAAIAAALDAEQRRIVPLVAAILFALLLAVYRSPVLALGALLPALGGIAWVGALQDALGFTINPVTALLPPVLLAVGVAGSVHLVDAFLDERARGAAPNEASRRAVRAVWAPALGCAATTVVGFAALLASPIPAIDRFGLLAAAGVTLTVGLAFASLPPWLRWTASSPGLIRRAAGHGAWRPASAVIARALARSSARWVGLALVAALGLGWAWTRLEVDTHPLRILPAHHPFRLATERIGARLGGTEVFDVWLPPPGPGGLLALLGLQKDLLDLPGVVGPAGPPRTAEDGTALVSLLLAPAGSTAREATFATAEERARERGWSAALAMGPAVRMARDSGAIVRGEILGLLATFLALGPCVWLGLRSLRLTGLALAANVFPCLLLHGGLALAGRPLSVASAMIGSVILGLVIDNAIYFLHGFRAARRELHPRLAVARTLQTSGRALSVTALVLALAFLAGLTGELTTTREFGVLAAASILAAWGANVFLLPALLLLRRRVGSARR
jgi:hypothetical protein